MGGLFIYKRFYAKGNMNISMHFENPRSTMEAARVKMCKLNEIMISRHHNNNKRDGLEPATMIDEQEATDLTSPRSADDTRRLLL